MHPDAVRVTARRPRLAAVTVASTAVLVLALSLYAANLEDATADATPPPTITINDLGNFSMSPTGHITTSLDYFLRIPKGVATFTSDGLPYAVVTASDRDSVQVINMTYPNNPTAAGRATNGSDGFARLDGAAHVATITIGDAPYAVVTSTATNSDPDGVQLINMTDPDNLVAAGTATNDAAFELTNPAGVATFTHGVPYAVVTSANTDSVQLINLNNPSSLGNTSSIADGGGFLLENARGVDTITIANKPYAIVTNNNGNDGVQLIDLSDPTSPTAAGNATDGRDGFTTLRNSYAVAATFINGVPYAVVAAIDDNGVQVINLSDPDNPAPAGRATDGLSFPELERVSGVAIATVNDVPYAVVTSYHGNSIQLIDLSDPDNLRPAGNATDGHGGYNVLQNANAAATFTTPTDPGATYAIVTSFSDNGIQIIRMAHQTETPVGVPYDDAGATCADHQGNAVTPTVSSTVDFRTVGTYHVTYTCEDGDGRTSTAARAVTVYQGPVLTVTGGQHVRVPAGSTYADQGAACTDRVDGAITGDGITTHGGTDVDTSTPGYYRVAYECTASDGRVGAASRVVEVYDAAPSITIAGMDTGPLILNPVHHINEDDRLGSRTVTLDDPEEVSVFKTNGKTVVAVALSSDDGVTTIDITDPANPRNPGYLGGMPGRIFGNAVAVHTMIINGEPYTFSGGYRNNQFSFQALDTSSSYPASVGFFTEADDDVGYLAPLGIAHVVAEGSINVLSAGFRGLSVINADDPTDMMFVSHILTGAHSDVGTITIDGLPYALALDSNKDTVRVVNMTDPYNPVVEGSAVDDTHNFRELNSPRSVATFTGLDGTPYAVVVSGTDDGVQVINMTDPDNPVAAGNATDDEGGFWELEGAEDVATFTGLDGKPYAAVTGYSDDGIQLIDLSDPDNLKPAGQARDDRDGFWELEGADGIDLFVYGGVLHGIVGALDDDGLQIFTITHPPERIPVGSTPYADQGATCTDHLGAAKPANATGTVDSSAAGTYQITYECMDGDGRTSNATRTVVVYPAPPPAIAISDLGGLSLEAAGNATDDEGGFLALDGASGVATATIGGKPYAVVASRDDDGVQLIDLSDPDNLAPAGHATNGTGGFDSLGGARDIATVIIDGLPYAVVSAFDDNGAQFINMTDPSGLTVAGGAEDGTDGMEELGGALGVATIAIDGKTYAVFAARNDNGVQLIDISDPASPTAAGHATDSEGGFWALDGARGVATITIKGTPYALVAAFDDDRVQFIDLSDPDNPVAVGHVAEGSSGFTELNGPAAAATITIKGTPYAVVAAYYDDGVQLINISDPASPTAAGHATRGGNDSFWRLDGANGVATTFIDGVPYAIVTSERDHGVQFIDLSDPDNPVDANHATDGTDGMGELRGANGVATIAIDGKTYAVVSAYYDDGIQLIGMDHRPNRAPLGTPYDDPGAACTDYRGNTLTVTTTGTVDHTTPGAYAITYECTDTSTMQTAAATRTVMVDAPPVLALNGAATVGVVINATYADAGATCIDDLDGNITSRITTAINGTAVATVSIDTSAAATHTIAYDCSDLSNNPAPQLVRTVVVSENTPPVITVTGENPAGAAIMSIYHDAGATCTDTEDGDLTANMTTTGLPVDTSTTGDRTVTYSCTDSASQTATATRTVTIHDDVDPVITVTGLDPAPAVTLLANLTDDRRGYFPYLESPRGVDTFKVLGQDNYAVIAANTDNAVQIVNLADPANPSYSGYAVDGVDDFTHLGGARGVAMATVDGVQYAVVAASHDNAIQLIKVADEVDDTADPSSPKPTGFSADVTNLDGATDVAMATINGTPYAVVAAFNSNYVQVVDISDPEKPSTAGHATHSTAGFGALDGPRGVAVAAINGITYAVVASSSSHGIQLINMTDPYNLAPAGTATDGTGGFTHLGGARDVAVFRSGAGHYAAVAAADDGVQIVDISDPDNPVAAGAAADSTSGNPTDFRHLDGAMTVDTFTLNGRTYAAVASYRDDGFQLIDLTDPSNPAATGHATRGQDGYAHLDGPYGVAVFTHDNLHHAILTSENDNALTVVRMSPQPTVIQQNSTYTDPGATCSDNVDAAITDVATAGADLDTSVPGEHQVTYTCIDDAGNTATALRLVVVDAPPVITITGDRTVTVEAPLPYADDGATCTDAEDGDLAVDVAGLPITTTATGDHYVTYSCTDSANQTATVQRSVIVEDTTPPVIRLEGAATVAVLVNGTYNEPGATCTDSLEGDISGEIEVEYLPSAIVTSAPGNYTVTYNCADSSKNEADPATRTVTIHDDAPPAITLAGDNPLRLPFGTAYAEPGATCTDAEDGARTLSITGAVDHTALGNYIITYQCSDTVPQTSVLTRTVTVYDDVRPQLTVLGDNPLAVQVNATFTDPWVSCTDNHDGDISQLASASFSHETDNHLSTTTLTIGTAGDYTIEYACTDESNNKANATRTVLAREEAPPVITISALEDAQPYITYHLDSYDIYVEAGAPPTATHVATCADVPDGDLQVTTTGTIDYSVTGYNAITHTCTDSAGQTATVQIFVHIADTTPPVITLHGHSPLDVLRGDAFTDPGAACADTFEGRLPVTAAGTVDTSAAGDYTITYDCFGSENDAAQLTRTVRVVDVTVFDRTNPLHTGQVHLRVLPQITLNGDNPASVTAGSAYLDAGAICTDAQDGILPVTTRDLEIRPRGGYDTLGNVDASTPGTYHVYYRCTDTDGHSTVATRAVVVRDTPPPPDPVFAINGSNPATVAQHGTYRDAGATCSDHDLRTDNQVDTSIPGTYYVFYICGNDIAFRTVHVAEATN